MLGLSQETIAGIGATLALATLVTYLSITSGDRAHQRFETLERHLDQRFDAVDQRFETLERRLDQRFDNPA